MYRKRLFIIFVNARVLNVVCRDKMEQPKFMQNRVKLGRRDASRRRISATTEDRGYLPV